MATLVEPARPGSVAPAERPAALRRIGREAVAGGRHRRGTPGLISVTALVTVVRRGLLASWLRPGRHRRRVGW